MTEKNTLSILENIKKKMQKFDQQTKKIETVSGIDDEFEYIPSSKNKSDIKIEVADVAAENAIRDKMQNNLSELDTDSLAKPTSVSDSNVEAPKYSSPIEDDLNLDDLSDLDSHHPQDLKVETPIQESVQSSPDLTENNHFDDLSLDDEEEEEGLDVESNKYEKDLDDDMDFDLNLDLEDDEEISENVAAEIEIEEPKIDVPELNQKEVSSLVANNDIDLEQLLKDEEEAKNKQTQQTKSQPTPDSSNVNQSNIDEEQFLKDLGIDSSPAKPDAPFPNLENNKTETVPENKRTGVISNELLDDIDLDDLDDLEKTMVVDDKIVNDSGDILSEQDVSEEIEEKKSAPVKSENTQSLNSELETVLQNQNFAEIAMHILEPKLDAWLDQHLHGLVEKIVQEEVKRLFEKR